MTTLMAAVFVLASLVCKAQPITGGVTAGLVTSQIDGDGYAGFHQIGWTAGVFGRIPDDDYTSWQLELRYSLFGSHSGDKEVEYGYLPMDIRLHYVELPVLYRYQLSRFSVNGMPLDFVTLEFGLNGDFLVKNSQSANHENPVENPAWWFFSVSGSVGVQIDLNDRLGINLRSTNSLTPCRWRAESPSIFYGHYYNIALLGSVTYTINALGDQKGAKVNPTESGSM